MNIFYNVEEQNLRAGWRMAIFLVALTAGIMIVNPPLMWILKHFIWLSKPFASEFIFYGALLLITFLVIHFLERRPFASVGLAANGRVLKELGQGIFIGGGMITIVFVIEYSAGMIALTFKPLSVVEVFQYTSTSAGIFVLGAFGEEILFRGYLFQTLAEGAGKTIAVAAFAVFFGVAHSSNPHVTFFSMANIALAGVFLSAAYLKTRSLWFPVALHFTWNFLMNHIYSFPVSGIQFGQYQLGVLIQSGPEWLTGGTFGPEGGALATLVLIGGTAFIWFSPWIRISEKAWLKEQWLAARMQTAANTAITEDAGTS
ncbi:MAG: CPBP family intramembrane metalloprotease [Bacteroidota bacterium]|nr:CPBP family intramembrane metalloprotease [Bacteroidota bacterium]